MSPVSRTARNRKGEPGDAHFPSSYPTLAGLVRTGLRPHVAALWLTAGAAAATTFLPFALTSLLAGWRPLYAADRVVRAGEGAEVSPVTGGA